MFRIYQEITGVRHYVTHVMHNEVGLFGGHGAEEQAATIDDPEHAKALLEWLNDPESFYGTMTSPYVLEEFEVAAKICECPAGTDRCITQGGHFPACTACGRRLRRDSK